MGEKDMHESKLNAAQPARHPRKKKRGRAGKVIRKTVKIVVVLVLAVGAGLFGLKAYIGKQAEENQGESYSRATVTRGAMEETVYGTGTTAARNQTHVLAGADGTLTDLRVSVGDEVKAGDILAVLTNADLDDEITDLEFDLGFNCLGMRSNNPVLPQLEEAFADTDTYIYTIGDSVRARRIMEGTMEGRAILNVLESQGYLHLEPLE